MSGKSLEQNVIEEEEIHVWILMLQCPLVAEIGTILIYPSLSCLTLKTRSEMTESQLDVLSIQ